MDKITEGQGLEGWLRKLEFDSISGSFTTAFTSSYRGSDASVLLGHLKSRVHTYPHTDT